MAPSRVINLRFPTAGIVRRLGFEVASDIRSAAHAGNIPSYASPWAVNCRPEDAIAFRLRGGSRPGLTKYVDDDLGVSVSSIVPVPVVSSSGVSTRLAVVADDFLGVIEGGALTTPKAYLKTESGNYVTTEAGNKIVVSTANVPTGCFLVVRGGKVYAIASSMVCELDTATGIVDVLAANKGAVPTGCTFGVVYRDRLVLAGRDNAIYLSRQGNFRDWFLGESVGDSGRATAFQLAEAGEIGGLVTALVSHKDAFLLAATSNSLWVVQGDPCSTGTFRCVSRDVGVIGSSAWCKVGDTIVFLSANGVYSVSADGSNLTPLSADRLPSELRNVAVTTTTVRMAHKNSENGVHLFLTPTSGVGSHWFFDLDNRGFWLDAMQADHQPTAVCEVDGDVVLACSDGYLRKIGGVDDDGAAIESHILIGPLQLGSPNDFGIILNLHGMLGASSGAVSWRIVTGDTAEEACENAKTAIGLFQASDDDYLDYVKASGDWSAGRSPTIYPRLRAMWAVLWLQSSSQWAYEGVTMETSTVGRWR